MEFLDVNRVAAVAEVRACSGAEAAQDEIEAHYISTSPLQSTSTLHTPVLAPADDNPPTTVAPDRNVRSLQLCPGPRPARRVSYVGLALLTADAIRPIFDRNRTWRCYSNRPISKV